MNIILLIFAFISTISLITYAQLANLRELAAVRKEYACYMETQERAAFIEAQNRLYDNYHRKGKEKDGDGTRVSASRKLNLHSFLYAQEDSIRSYTIDTILKNLLDIHTEKLNILNHQNLKIVNYFKWSSIFFKIGLT